LPKHPLVLSILLLAACSNAPSTRESVQLIDKSDMAAIGATAFDQLKRKSQLSADYESTRLLRCVANQLIAKLPNSTEQNWEIVVFEDNKPNAFALPGGKLGMSTGMLKLAGSPAQLAAIISHELGHIEKNHATQRVSSGFTADAAVAAVQSYRAELGPQPSRALYALLGLGSLVGTALPYSRTDEAQADRAGLQLLAQAGYDPSAAVELWTTLATPSDTPPQWLQAHPDPQQRLASVRELQTTIKPSTTPAADCR